MLSTHFMLSLESEVHFGTPSLNIENRRSEENNSHLIRVGNLYLTIPLLFFLTIPSSKKIIKLQEFKMQKKSFALLLLHLDIKNDTNFSIYLNAKILKTSKQKEMYFLKTLI